MIYFQNVYLSSIILIFFSITPTEVGGDIDVLKTETENLIYLGDVTGHGVPASFISAISSALMLNNMIKRYVRALQTYQ